MLLKLLVAMFAFASIASPASTVGASPLKPSTAVKASARHARLPLRTTHALPTVVASAAPTPRLSGHYISVYNALNKQALSASDNLLPVNEGSPPDTTGAIGPNYYVETVNSVIGVY